MPKPLSSYIFLGIIVLAVFVIWFALYGPRPLSLSSFPSVKDSQNVTSNWSTHTYSEYGFKIKYPSNYIEEDSFGYDGVSLKENGTPGSWSCLIFAWPTEDKIWYDSDSIRWKQKISLNGTDAERLYIIRSNFYEFEAIVLREKNHTYILESQPDSNKKTCNLIFSTFTLT